MIKNFLDDENEHASHRETAPAKPIKTSEPTVITLFDSVDGADSPAEAPYTSSSPAQVSTEETIRRTGLAWTVGIVFFSSVIAMLVLGWGADLLLGSSPWGVVIGIVIGSLIAFFQLFRLSSQIFKT